MSSNGYLKERAILMRLSLGLPGQTRQDKDLSETVKSEHDLGEDSGGWIKNIYPPKSLKPAKKIQGSIRNYFRAVTFSFDKAMRILPAALIMENAKRIADYNDQLDQAIDEFIKHGPEHIAWAIKAHNGNFDPCMYPGVYKHGTHAGLSASTIQIGKYDFDPEEFARVIRSEFTFVMDPLPVPQSSHYTDSIASLLGIDTQSIDRRIAQVELETRKELMKRLIGPVQAMAKKLAEEPKKDRDAVIFRDSLVGNIKEIAELGPKMNLSGDPVIDRFCKELETLCTEEPDKLREDNKVREDTRKKAEALAAKMAAYNF